MGEQTYIGTLSCGDSGKTATTTTITYDKDGITPLVVGSNKSIVGVGAAGIILTVKIGLGLGISKGL